MVWIIKVQLPKLYHRYLFDLSKYSSKDEIEFKSLRLAMNTLYFDVNFESKSVKWVVTVDVG